MLPLEVGNPDPAAEKSRAPSHKYFFFLRIAYNISIVVISAISITIALIVAIDCCYKEIFVISLFRVVITITIIVVVNVRHVPDSIANSSSHRPTTGKWITPHCMWRFRQLVFGLHTSTLNPYTLNPSKHQNPQPKPL